MGVVNYYEKRRMFASATNRLNLIEKEYVTFFPEAEPQLLYKKLQIAQKGNAKELIAKNEAVLNERFPNYLASINAPKATSVKTAQKASTVRKA